MSSVTPEPAPERSLATDTNGDPITPTSGLRLFVIAWLTCTAMCGYFEFDRLMQAVHSPAGVLGWLSDWNAETTLPLIVLFSLWPLIWLIERNGGTLLRRRRTSSFTSEVSPDVRPCRPGYQATTKQLIGSGVVLFSIAVAASAVIGFREVTVPLRPRSELARFADLPPAYHDEFSYLLQARTFLAGRWSWPAATVRPDLFHQVHVLNQPRTGSRYFPWTGLWIAPFESIHRPILGHWLAGGIACVFFYLSLVQLTEQRWAFFGGLLIALSPGIAVFSNLLLAHHPTMMALAIFLWAILRLMHSGQTAWALIAGLALTLAMLGRPMTAAGFALPFGIRTFRYPQRSHIVAMGLPLVAGFSVLLIQNVMITGKWNKSPYQLYTDTMTPRHRYGFNNVINGERMAARPLESDHANVLDAYDRWATNLTPQGALENVGQRLMASVQWTLGVVPVLFAFLQLIPAGRRRTPGFGADADFAASGRRCVFFSIVSLHAVHVPYWFVGIMHWHYVFETAPLLMVMTALGSREAFIALAQRTTSRVAAGWVLCLSAAAWLPGWIEADALWGSSKVTMAVSEQSFSRVRMAQFWRLIHSPQITRPALILVDESASDPQLSYIVNPPDLQSDVLVCRRPTDESGVAELQKAFADRTIWSFDPQSFELLPLSAPSRRGIAGGGSGRADTTHE